MKWIMFVVMLLAVTFSVQAVGILIPGQPNFDLDDGVYYAPLHENTLTFGIQNGDASNITLNISLQGDLQARFQDGSSSRVINLGGESYINNFFNVTFNMPDTGDHYILVQATQISDGGGSMIGANFGTNKRFVIKKPCASNWSCTEFGNCVSNVQTRICNDLNACKKQTSLPTLKQSCCNPSWVCDSWGSCVDGVRKKLCTDANNCGTDAGKPTSNDTQACPTPSNSGGSWSLSPSETVVAAAQEAPAVTPPEPVLTLPADNATVEGDISENTTAENTTARTTSDSIDNQTIGFIVVGAMLVFIIGYAMLKKKKKPTVVEVSGDLPPQ